MERRLRELDHWDELYGLGGLPPATPARGSRRRRGRSGGWVVVLGLGAAAVLFPTQALGLLDRATDLLPGGGEEPVSWASEVSTVVREASPLAAPPSQGQDRVLPEVAFTTGGDYAFLQTQPGSDEPVGFSPCSVVEVVVNPDRAPEGHRELVQASLARVSAATGILLELSGESTDTVGRQRDPGDPVLIGWASEADVPGLQGRTAGFGGPLIMTDRVSGRSWLASGTVALDAAGLGADVPAATAAVLDHELAHVMGLGHVGDPTELMAATNTGQTGFGPGDLEGLARLGAIDCR